LPKKQSFSKTLIGVPGNLRSGSILWTYKLLTVLMAYIKLRAMEMIELEKYAGRKDFRTNELLEVADSLMKMVAPVQPSERVAETVNERALRYYISEGLIDRPSDREGNAALYSYRHLLQILAVKKLQASYLPVKRIREIVPESTDEELKEIICGKKSLEPAPAESAALQYLSSILPEGDMLSEPPAFQHRHDIAAPSQLFTRESFGRPPITESWERHVIDDGIEIHIRADRKGILRKGELKRMVERFLRLLGS
jgi:DNA-binding transcriptional MerR regulator